ncbi:hypothetical protein FEM48_Zijuj07G0048200 [Ziziphus jujuba var. spinosa]|uniref:Uncharacterized protein n=1 Tax=Ziziphus jujuba var. spinosa TaxID=714518 RepID=A0A978V2J5_ZIZJJ|nr:hypothetical protein FEM48_Zijuj07G0048200 [Ziziphus jujuba var. spinosa]
MIKPINNSITCLTSHPEKPSMVDLRRRPRFLLIAFPVQGHINPSLHFAKRLISIGAHVTFVTALSAHCRVFIGGSTPVARLSLAPFSDGYDDGVKPDVNMEHYMSEISCCGSKHLSDLILSGAGAGQPFTGLVSTIFMPWAMEVADELQIPSALLWVQLATLFDLFYYFFNGYGDLMTNSEDVWETGLRVKANEEGIVEKDEIKRCLELLMGDGEIGEEIRRNAEKWKALGREAAMEGGSSYKNIKAFLGDD